MKVLLRYLAFLLLVSVLALAAGWGWLSHWAESPMQIKQQDRLVVPRGETLYQLANTLADKGWIADSRLLRWYSRLTRQGNRIQTGEYLIIPGVTPQQLIDKIRAGEVITYTITLVNGQTYQAFVQRLHQDPVLLKTLNPDDPAPLLERLGSPYDHPEGLFYPDTYRFQRGDSDFDILRRAYLRMQSLLSAAWQQRAEGLPYDTAYQALIMASIIEKETAVASERGLIAGVFVNRLQKKMRLQTDPTVIYGLGDRYQGNLTRNHLKTYSPYNTYRIAGLPPTPIANPALPAIEAALHPQDTDALYFVAKGDGSHQFSNNLESHVKAVKQYQWKRRADYRSSPQTAE